MASLTDGSACALVDGRIQILNAFDACFSSHWSKSSTLPPMQKKPTTKTQQAKFGKWFGCRRAEAYLSGRAVCWLGGVPTPCTSPAHDALTVGFLLAHREHLANERLSSNGINQRTIKSC